MTTTAAAATRAAAAARLQAEFERAADASDCRVNLRLVIAGADILLRFADTRAADALGHAFAHVATEDDRPAALTVHVWDGAETAGVRDAVMPSAAAMQAQTETEGASYVLDGDGYRALYQPAYGALSVLTAEGDAGWYCAPDVTRLPPWEHASPMRHLLSWWLAGRGFMLVHAGAVGTPSGGVLLVGRGGSGKSTTALATLADARLRYAGDDYAAVGGSTSTPWVHSLYCSGKVHRRDLRRLPHLAAPAATDEAEKAIFYVADAFPGRAIDGFPLRAVLLPRVTGRRVTRAVPATPVEALAALAPSTIFQLYPPAREALPRMAALLRAVPSYVLELGEVETTTEIVRLLDGVGA